MDVSAKLDAVGRLRAALSDALQPRPPDAARVACTAALSLKSGVPAVDDALVYVDTTGNVGPDEIPEYGRVAARLGFVCDVLDALREPIDAPSGRGRKQVADEAAVKIREAGELLARLGNDGMGVAFNAAADVIAACAARETIDDLHLSNTPIVPGAYAAVKRHASRQSAYHVSARGPASHRSEMIRFLSRRLRANANATVVATLVEDVCEIRCTAADVHMAREDKKAEKPAPHATAQPERLSVDGIMGPRVRG